MCIRDSTSVDQAILTGEALPVDKMPGDPVFCGTINRFGVIELIADKVGEDSSLQKLIRMVRQAEENKAPMQRIADRWASWLVPVALLIAIAAYLVTGDIVRGVTVLVVFCPCALVLATPTAIMAVSYTHLRSRQNRHNSTLRHRCQHGRTGSCRLAEIQINRRHRRGPHCQCCGSIRGRTPGK